MWKYSYMPSCELYHYKYVSRTKLPGGGYSYVYPEDLKKDNPKNKNVSSSTKPKSLSSVLNPNSGKLGGHGVRNGSGSSGFKSTYINPENPGKNIKPLPRGPKGNLLKVPNQRPTTGNSTPSSKAPPTYLGPKETTGDKIARKGAEIADRIDAGKKAIVDKTKAGIDKMDDSIAKSNVDLYNKLTTMGAGPQAKVDKAVTDTVNFFKDASAGAKELGNSMKTAKENMTKEFNIKAENTLKEAKETLGGLVDAAKSIIGAFTGASNKNKNDFHEVAPAKKSNAGGTASNPTREEKYRKTTKHVG